MLRTVHGDGGSVALLSVMGGGLVLLVALIPVVVVADVIVARQRAQVAADAAALAAMLDPTGGGRGQATPLAQANGAQLLACCGDRVDRRQVTVGVAPASRLVAAVVARVETGGGRAGRAGHPCVGRRPRWRRCQAARPRCRSVGGCGRCGRR